MVKVCEKVNYLNVILWLDIILSIGALKVREGGIISLAFSLWCWGQKPGPFVCRTSALLLSYTLKVKDCLQGQNTAVQASHQYPPQFLHRSMVQL